MKYRNLLEVAEAVFYGRMQLLSPENVGVDLFLALDKWKAKGLYFPGLGMDGDGHRMWFCLFVHEAMK